MNRYAFYFDCERLLGLQSLPGGVQRPQRAGGRAAVAAGVRGERRELGKAGGGLAAASLRL